MNIFPTVLDIFNFSSKLKKRWNLQPLTSLFDDIITFSFRLDVFEIVSKMGNLSFFPRSILENGKINCFFLNNIARFWKYTHRFAHVKLNCMRAKLDKHFLLGHLDREIN